ncbi:MAG TPA: NAD-dependent epimerase/dehydratase family protein [Acidimicrobiales bacterium]|nr:NAD-dependent epimerase/dehydratase family protein [Acidimicrobiales bacterium]
MRALVTGGAGFIGSALVDRLLAEGHVVDAVDDLSSGSLANLAEARRRGRGFSFTQLDVRDPALTEHLALHRPEVVFHLAAQSSVLVSTEHPLRDAEVNVLGGLRLLDAARAGGVKKVVFAASGGALYDEPAAGARPVDERAPRLVRSPYGAAKRAMLDYLACYRELYGLEYSALALGNVYGPRQDASGEGGVVAIFATRLLAGEPCEIHGDGSQVRDFVFVDDVVDAFSRAAGRGSGLVLNIGTGVGTTIAELYERLRVLTGSRAKPRRAPARPGDARVSVLDAGRAALHLGWKPWTPLDEGLALVVEACRSGVPR